GATGPGLHVLPALAAERAELGIVAVRAHVAADAGELVRGREDLVPAAVLELEIVAGDPGEGLGVEPGEARDPVVLVHDEVAHPQFNGRCKAATLALGRGRSGRRAAAVKQAPLRERGQPTLGREEPRSQAGPGDARPGLLGCLVGEEWHVEAGQVVAGALGLAAALEGDHRPVAGAGELLELSLGLREGARRELGPL